MLSALLVQRPISWKRPGLDMFNMNFLIADVIQFVSGRMTAISQGMEQKSNLSSSKSLAQTMGLTLIFLESW